MANPGAARGTASSGGQTPKRERRRRGSITAEEIINGAFELADEVTLSGLSMPLLAKHLGVGVTSIYWYFRKKDELLDAMTDRATRQYHFATPFIGDETWQDGLRNHCRTMRRVFREKPVLCDLILMRTSELSVESMRASVEKLEAVVNTMVDAGFSPANALDVYSALSLHIRGVAVLEHLDTVTPAPGSARASLPTAEDAPLLHDLAARGHSTASITDANYELTVDAIIEHAERLLAQDLSRAESALAKPS
jgi:AcrR family transcriptional regulator